MQFLYGLGLGFRAHPGVVLQAVFKGLLQVFHQLHHTLLAALGEVLLNIQFAYGFTQKAANQAHGTLPAGLLLLNTRDFLTGLKRTVAEFVRQEARETLDYAQFHKCLPVVNTCVG